MPLLTSGKRNPTYIYGTLKGSPTKKHVELFSTQKSQNRSTKEEHILKFLKIRADAYRASNGRKCKGGESTSPTNPEKGCTGKRKKNYADHLSDRMTGDKHAWCMDPYTPQRSAM